MPRIKVDGEEPDRTINVIKEPTGRGITAVDGELREKSGGFLTAFAAFPKKTKFSGEMADEEVILLMRAHPIVNFLWILITVIIFVAPSVIFPLAISYNLLPPLPGGFELVLFILWYLGAFAYAFVNFLYWYFNVYIVTNERIVDVDWYSLIHREMSIAQVSKIQDIHATQVGVLAGIFDYGHVLIQTAGEVPNFDFLNVPHPQLVVQKIQELMQVGEKRWEPNL